MSGNVKDQEHIDDLAESLNALLVRLLIANSTILITIPTSTTKPNTRTCWTHDSMKMNFMNT